MLRRVMIAGPGVVPPGGPDPHWSSVSSLLHFNGADGSTVFTDQKGVSWSATGNAKISTAASKFGGSSLTLDGAGSWIDASSASFVLGTGDFTIESWVRFDGSAGNRFLWGHHSGWGFYVNGADAYVFNGSANKIVGVGVATGGVWTHVAFTRASGTMRAFWGGAQFGSGVSDSTNFTGTNFRIGAQTSGGGAMSGNVDDFRITAGVARYTASFTPPASQFPDY